MKLLHKLLLAFFVVISLFWLLATLSINFSKQALQENIIHGSIALADKILDEIHDLIHRRIEGVQAYATDVLLQRSIEESNSEFAGLDGPQAHTGRADKERTPVPGEDAGLFAGKFMDTPLVRELNEQRAFYDKRYGNPLFTGISVINKYGVIIAQTGRPPDYGRDDGQLWRQTRAEGLYISDVAYDKSADLYTLDFSVRVDNDEGEFIGAIRATLNIREAFDIIGGSGSPGLHRKYHAMNYKLANEKGQLIYATEKFEFLDDINTELAPVFGDRDQPSHVDYSMIDAQEGKEKFIVHAHSKDKEGIHLGWTLLMIHNSDRIFSPIILLKSRIQTALLFITAAALALCLFFSRSVTIPIAKLKKAVETMNDSNLDSAVDIKTNDEIGLFASSFKEMAGRLKEAAYALKTKNDELAESNILLSESEERFRALSKTATDAIILIDDNGRVAEWNQGAERMFHYSEMEALGKEVHLLIAPERYHAAYKSGFGRYRNEGDGPAIGNILELTALRKDGTEFPMEVSTSSFIVKARRHTVGIVRDITDRKRAQMELLNRQEELKALYKVSSVVGTTLDLDKLFDITLATITGLEIFKVESKAGIFIIENDNMELAAHFGHSKPFLDGHKNMKIGTCLCGMAAETGKVIISSNSERDKRHTIRYAGMNCHGHIIIPLKVRARVIGVLYLYTEAEAVIDDNKINTMLAIGNQIGVAIDNAKLFEETKEFSYYDPLTGLANRRMMSMVFQRNLTRAGRSHRPFSIMMIDIDYFKKYNDTHGHQAGDGLLSRLAKLINRKIRQSDLAVRYGGEEFIVLLPETDMENAAGAAERLRKAAESTLGITISIGVALYSEGTDNEEDFIKKADDALYQAKQKGRNRVVAGPSHSLNVS